MRHGKDYMTDKAASHARAAGRSAPGPEGNGAHLFDLLFRALRDTVHGQGGRTGQGWRHRPRAPNVGLGPHALHNQPRPDWFFRKEPTGGILADIASHQVDQFLYFADVRDAEVVSSQVANYNNPQYPEFEDFGEIVLSGGGATGYIRVDWFTPSGLGVWGDGRLFIMGTEGYIELRKYVDIAGKPGAHHLFLVDKAGTRYIDCKNVPLPYGGQLIDDVLNRTETAMGQEHCFLASRLCLEAEAKARRLGHLAGNTGG